MTARRGATPLRLSMLSGMNPETLDHVALWVADRDRIAEFLTGGAGMHIVERTDAFTLVGSDARRGKLTLFAEEGPRERGPLKHVALRVSDLEQLWPTCRRTPTSNGHATARPTSTSTRD